MALAAVAIPEISPPPPMGTTMGESDGFAKVVIDRENGKILGGHIVGSHASILVHEIINVMNCRNANFLTIKKTMHIHPALSEVVQNAFQDIDANAV